MMRKWVSSPAYRLAVELLIAERKAAGLTQREVEGRLGKTHHGYLAKIEGIERQANIIDVIAIARAIGANEKEFFERLLLRLPTKLDV